MEIDAKVQDYLRQHYGPETKLTGLEPVGKGVHGTAYRMDFRWRSEKKRLIMKTLAPTDFGHDHFSDRGQVLILANANFNEMPRHIKAFDVIGESEDRLLSLKRAREFYLLMEEAKGESYFQDLDAILERGSLTRSDRSRARMLARFLADIHAEKYTGSHARSLYRRRIRELVGHGECIMGVIDAYRPVDFATEEELITFAEKALPWWGRLRDRSERLCAVHGDFHPDNIRLNGEELTLLDRSRGTWGEPADDVSCLGMNYIYYALKHSGNFDGPFAELFQHFMDTYQERTDDRAFYEVSPPFFAFRVLVVANPDFYPADPPAVKRRLLDFGQAVLETDRFRVEDIPNYLEGP